MDGCWLARHAVLCGKTRLVKRLGFLRLGRTRLSRRTSGGRRASASLMRAPVAQRTLSRSRSRSLAAASMTRSTSAISTLLTWMPAYQPTLVVTLAHGWKVPIFALWSPAWPTHPVMDSRGPSPGHASIEKYVVLSVGMRSSRACAAAPRDLRSRLRGSWLVALWRALILDAVWGTHMLRYLSRQRACGRPPSRWLALDPRVSRPPHRQRISWADAERLMASRFRTRALPKAALGSRRHTS
jgi:hypothetical protein